MRLPFLRPKPPKPASPNDRLAPAGEPVSVLLARIQARRRLAGALVLLGVGIAVFPVLFETQPRPIAIDTPIVMPARDASPVVRGPVARSPVVVLPADAGIEGLAAVPAPSASVPSAARPAQAQAQAQAQVETQVEAVAMAEPARAPPTVASAPSASKAAPPAAKPAIAASRPDDGARAQALLDARTAASEPKAGTLRFVVQAGAYSEPGALRDARQKVEKLGLKTYTQVIENDTGKRTRVRVGPYATRQEAEAVAAKVKAAGLQASILAL